MKVIIDVFNHFKESPKYNKLVGDDYLLMEYKCPIDTEKFHLLSEFHFITYVISGRKDWITSDKTYELREGEALFVRKGVYVTRQHFEVDYCVLLFFISDDFIKNFILENKPVGSTDNHSTIDEDIFKIDVDDQLQSLFYSMFNYLKLGEEMPRSLVEMKFKELLFNVVLNQKE